MHELKKIAILFIFSILFAIPPSLSFGYDEENLANLENLANRRMEEGYPEHALILYLQYEKSLTELGNVAMLQPDLLYNQVVAAYQAEHLGEAVAYLKQLTLIDSNPEYQNALRELRMLVEHRIYQKNPGLMFIRGESPDYILWETFRRYTDDEVQTLLFCAWNGLFFLVGVVFLIWHRRNSRKLFLVIVSLTAAFLVFLAIFAYQQFRTKKMNFGVVMSVDNLRIEPGSDSKGVYRDEGFIPGTTVRVLKEVNDWLLVRRVDDVMVWMPQQDLYILRSRGEQKSADYSVNKSAASMRGRNTRQRMAN